MTAREFFRRLDAIATEIMADIVAVFVVLLIVACCIGIGGRALGLIQ